MDNVSVIECCPRVLVVAVVSCAKAGGPAIVPTVNTMTEIARPVPRIFSRSDIEEIALIMRSIPYLKKTLLAFEP